MPPGASAFLIKCDPHLVDTAFRSDRCAHGLAQPAPRVEIDPRQALPDVRSCAALGAADRTESNVLSCAYTDQAEFDCGFCLLAALRRLEPGPNPAIDREQWSR
jgi:hypothetical protein